MELPSVVWYVQENAKAEAVESHLLRARYSIRIATNPDDLKHAIRSVQPVAVCFDFISPSNKVLEEIRSFKGTFPDVPLILVTQTRSVSLAIWGIRMQVWDYIQKPVEISRISASISRIVCPSSDNEPALDLQEREIPRRDSMTALSISSRTSQRIRSAIYFIETHFSQEFSQADIAEKIAMSNSYFSRTFHQVTGVPFASYVSKTRIRAAKELLKNLSLPITTVCFESGFKDPAYFSRVFHQETGMSPSEYRRHLFGNNSGQVGHPFEGTGNSLA